MRRVGRYELHEPFAAGGMATVHFGVETTKEGRRALAMKRVETKLGRSAAALVAEARIARHVRHPNVTMAIDLVETADEVVLVLEYVEGPSLDVLLERLRRRGETMPLPIARAVVVGALRGLAAIHAAADQNGRALDLVHRDVSPENILVGADGVAKITDLGIAKGVVTGPHTTTGSIKGKLRYLSPEQVHGEATSRSDVFAMGVTAWEVLVGRRLFAGGSESEVLARILVERIKTPSEAGVVVPADVERVVARALRREPGERFASATEMADALEATGPVASSAEVARFVAEHHDVADDERAARLAELRAPRRRRRLRALWLIALGVVAVAAVGFELRRPPPPPARADTPPEASSVSSAAPTVTLSAESEPTATAKAPPLKPALHAPASRPAPPAECHPPYVIDAEGRKHFKPECF